MKTVDWSDRAIADLEDIDDYWLENAGPAAAEEIAAKIETAASFLATMPGAGPAIRGRARKWSVPTTRYLLVYRVINDGIEVLRVNHGSQNWTRG